MRVRAEAHTRTFDNHCIDGLLLGEFGADSVELLLGENALLHKGMEAQQLIGRDGMLRFELGRRLSNTELAFVEGNGSKDYANRREAAQTPS